MRTLTASVAFAAVLAAGLPASAQISPRQFNGSFNGTMTEIPTRSQYGPTVNSRQLHPTQRPLESKWDRRNNRVQPEVDHLYERSCACNEARILVQ